MKKATAVVLILMMGFVLTPQSAFAESNATYGEITGKTVVGGICSLLLWPGIGQYLNDEESDKVVTHVIVGLFPPFRLWSGWDALVERKGGYWKGRV